MRVDDDDDRLPAELRPKKREELASTTPFPDLLVDVLLMASLTGGALALIIAIGFIATGSDSRALPYLALVAALVVANLAARAIRNTRR